MKLSHLVSNQKQKNILTTTQWLSVISIGVSLVGIYNKRKKIQNFLAPPPSPAPPPLSLVDVAPLPSSRVAKTSIRRMD